MKFYPYKLSEQRLSLLSDEDKRLYEYEHSDYYDWPSKQKALLEYKIAMQGLTYEYLNEMRQFEELQNESEETLHEYAQMMAEFESEYIMESLKEILRPIITEGCLTEEEYDQIINDAKETMENPNPEYDSLNEYSGTDGPDMTFWAKGLVGLTLGPLFTGMGALLLAGKTAAAIDSLKKYMNRVVETVDDGINKKRSIFATIGNKLGLNKIFNKGKKFGANSGDQSISCLRAIQEMFEGNIACKSMVLMKNMGLLQDNWEASLGDLQSNKFNNGGFQEFLNKIAQPVYKLTNKI